MLYRWGKKLGYKINKLYNICLARHEKKIIDNVLNSPGFGRPIINIPPTTVKKICFIIPGIEKHSGGITSILRLGTYLFEMEYEIVYADFTGEKVSVLKKNARFNLKDYKGDIKTINDTKADDFDVVIASNWQAVYSLSKYSAYKMYFVQDYEPYFFKLNERFLLAKLTYELGLHIVSLGKWNIKQIKRECASINSILDSVSFPYEPKEYSQSNPRDYNCYKNKSCFKIAVYTKEEGKRIPNILQNILSKTRKEMSDRGIRLELIFFGMEKFHKTSIGINLGKLTKDKLEDLYIECDFGMVASMTNVSLVPYEMIATGLPVIEFKDGSFPSFFPDGAAILIDFDYMTLVEGLSDHIENPEKIQKKVDAAQKALNGLSWENTAVEFSKILYLICKNI